MLLELPGSSPISFYPWFLYKHTRSKAPSLCRHYRLRRYYGPFRLPHRPPPQRRCSRTRPLDGTGLPRCVESLPCVPFPLPRWTATGSVGCDIPPRGSLPQQPGGSASMTSLSRPAQDSLALRPVRLQAHHPCALSPRLRHGRLPHRTAWVATGVNRKLPGRISHPLVLYTLVAHCLSPVSRPRYLLRETRAEWKKRYAA